MPSPRDDFVIRDVCSTAPQHIGPGKFQIPFLQLGYDCSTLHSLASAPIRNSGNSPHWTSRTMASTDCRNVEASYDATASIAVRQCSLPSFEASLSLQLRCHHAHCFNVQSECHQQVALLDHYCSCLAIRHSRFCTRISLATSRCRHVC